MACFFFRGTPHGVAQRYAVLRRRILELLETDDLTAGELAAHFDISKPTLSHHLATLKAAGLVTDERHGQNIVYSLNTTVMQDLIGWFLGFTEDSHE